MKKIAVFTGTRAEYGLMKVLIKTLNKSNEFDLYLLISSTHLNPKFGNTIDEIKNDGIDSKYMLPIFVDTNRKKDMSFQTAEVIKLVSSSLEQIKPEFLIVLGDRFESFGAASAAHLMGVKVIHLHGGETTLGALDDKLRHSITQLSTIHFTSADIHKKKVENMIGTSKNVYNIGPMVIDGLLNLKSISKEDFTCQTGFNFSKRNFLITFHPETLSENYGISGFENLLKVLKDCDCNILFTAPNADIGSKLIMKLIEKFVSANKNRSYFIPSLGQKLYLNALLLFDCVVGNSSSGMVEAPLLKTKVLNIGNRQQGRKRFGPVIDVNNDLDSISRAVGDILGNKKNLGLNVEDFKEIYAEESPTNKIIKIINDNF